MMKVYRICTYRLRWMNNVQVASTCNLSACNTTNLEDVCENLFGLPVEVRVDEGHVVVARYHVPESRQSLLHTLDLHCVRQRVPGGFIVRFQY